MRLHLAFATVVAVAGCLASPASAELQARPGGVFYDTVLDITWSGDANFAKTIGASATGLVNHQTANFLTQRYFYQNAATGVVYEDWRLPTLGPDIGNFDPFAIGYGGVTPNGQGALGTGWGTPDDSGIYSELGWMFYANLGGRPRCYAFTAGGDCIPDPLGGLPLKTVGAPVVDTGPFANLQLAHYWTDVPLIGIYGGSAYSTHWALTFLDGEQAPRLSNSPDPLSYVWLVHDGDIGAVSLAEPPGVPEPSTWATMLVGFASLGAALRRRRGRAQLA
jgi:hypothetical protein